MTQTAAHIRAVAKYNAKNYEQIKISVKKGFKDKVKKAAEEAGESMTGYIVKATENRMAAVEIINDPPIGFLECPNCGNYAISISPIQNGKKKAWRIGCEICKEFVVKNDKLEAINEWNIKARMSRP